MDTTDTMDTVYSWHTAVTGTNLHGSSVIFQGPLLPVMLKLETSHQWILIKSEEWACNCGVTTLQIKTVSGRVGVDTYWHCWNVRINAIANISCNTNNKIRIYNIAKRSSQILNRSVCILELGSPAYSLEVLHRSNEEACNTRTVISPIRLSWSPFWGKLSNTVDKCNLPCNFESRIEYSVSMFISVVALLTGSAASSNSPPLMAVSIHIKTLKV